MFTKQKPRQLDPRVKYQQRQFKGKLAKARTYQRPATGSFAAALRKFNWKLVAGVVIALGIAWYISFVPNFLFVRSVVVEGSNNMVSAEVRTQVLHYIEGKYFVFPKKNLLFTSKRDLTSYLTTANAHVWKVTQVRKKWPHDLIITIVPREPAFLWQSNSQQIIVANDGSVLPASESGDVAVLLPVFGQLTVTTNAGASVFEDGLLHSLTVIKNDFSRIAVLPRVVRVDLVPVLAEGFATNLNLSLQGQPGSAAAQDAAATATVPPAAPKTPAVLDVPPRELKVRVAADAAKAMPEFTVLLDVDDTNTTTLTRLKELLAGQPTDRLSHLAYVDMRFDSRVYICLTSAPCAKDESPAVIPQ